MTHNIEEALEMADRILLLTSDPGRLQAEIHVNLPYPRDPETKEFRNLLDKIYTLMTLSEGERLRKVKTPITAIKKPDFANRLPLVSVSEITGLLEEIESQTQDNKIHLPEIAESLHLDIDTLFPVTEALDMLHFAKISAGDIILLKDGSEFAKADIQLRKKIFAKHLFNFVPLAKHIRLTLDQDPNHRSPDTLFLEELSEHIPEEDALKLLKIIIDWGRYAEIFAYDSDMGILSLENPS